MSNNSIPSVSTLLDISSHAVLPSAQATSTPPQRPAFEGATLAPNGLSTAPTAAPAVSKETSAPRRGPWAPEEDHKLMEFIAVFGPTNWVRISNNLGTRTPKQCRERYHQNLKPTLNRTPITPEEGELIEQLVAKYGKKWAEIARHLNGRSDNSIKNWWNGGASKRRRASIQHDTLTTPTGSTKDDKSVHSQTKEPHPLPLPQLPLAPPQVAASAAPPTVAAPAMSQPAHQLPPIAFNTAMFATPSSKPSSAAELPRFDGAVLQHAPARASSLDYSSNQLPPVLSAKRRLIDEYPPGRRHSTATSITTSLNTSNASLSYNGNASPYHANHSPLLPSNPNSRHNSISVFEFPSLTTSSQNNSSTTSRRSSFAPDFFPNPLKDGSKHFVAGSTKFGDIPEVGGSPTQTTFNLAKSNSNLNHVFMAPSKKEDSAAGASGATSETKISVSSLID